MLDIDTCHSTLRPEIFSAVVLKKHARLHQLDSGATVEEIHQVKHPKKAANAVNQTVNLPPI